LTGGAYAHHQDLFTGERSVYAVPPELMAVLPETDVDRSHVSCAIVGNSAYLLDQVRATLCVAAKWQKKRLGFQA
jgi:hypothetical protein